MLACSSAGKCTVATIAQPALPLAALGPTRLGEALALRRSSVLCSVSIVRPQEGAMPSSMPRSPSLRGRFNATPSVAPAPKAAAAPTTATASAPLAAAAAPEAAAVAPNSAAKRTGLHAFLKTWGKERTADWTPEDAARTIEDETARAVHSFDPLSPGVVPLRQAPSVGQGSFDLNAEFGNPPPLLDPETVRLRRAKRDADASPDAAPAPASTPVSPGLALLRREMADVKGQPQLMAKLEKLVKSAERQKPREAARDAQQPDSAPRKPNLNMVFGGPPGAGKTWSVPKIAKVLADPELGVLKHAEVVVLNKDTTLPKGDTVPQRVGKLFESAKGCILFLDEAHKRTDSRAFVDALLPLLSKYEGEVMVIIAGYKDEIMNWLRSSDRGNPNPNP